LETVPRYDDCLSEKFGKCWKTWNLCVTCTESGSDIAEIRKLIVMSCCEITGFTWGKDGVLGWAAEILAISEIYRISVSCCSETDF
jgi:hypothetical protein